VQAVPVALAEQVAQVARLVSMELRVQAVHLAALAALVHLE
jgi:hypothetical protein